MKAASGAARAAAGSRGVVGRVCVGLGVLGVLLAGGEWAAAAEEPGYRRWAIVATKPLEEKGLPDLLAAEPT